MVEHSHKILAREEKAPTIVDMMNVLIELASTSSERQPGCERHDCRSVVR